MNTQNILKFYGSKLDIRLDSSEFYDYEVTKTENDYNSDVLDLSTSITYTALTINESLNGFGCSRNTIKLTEYDNRTNDPSYIYSGLSATVTYSSFVNHISPTYQHTILNDDVYEYEGLTGETHYFTITAFNQALSIHTGFTATNETDLILEKNPKLSNFVENEVKILTQIENEYVVKLYDVLRTSNNLYFVYEFCEGGTLEDLLK